MLVSFDIWGKAEELSYFVFSDTETCFCDFEISESLFKQMDKILLLVKVVNNNPDSRVRSTNILLYRFQGQLFYTIKNDGHERTGDYLDSRKEVIKIQENGEKYRVGFNLSAHEMYGSYCFAAGLEVRVKQTENIFFLQHSTYCDPRDYPIFISSRWFEHI